MTEMVFQTCLVGWFTKSVWMMMAGCFLEQALHDTHNANIAIYIYIWNLNDPCFDKLAS